MNTQIVSRSAFSDALRAWRRDVGISQLELAMRCGSSQKHISFLESGRSHPSRPMVASLCDALEVPLRDRNELLLAAGFAPKYAARDLSDPNLEAVQDAVRHLLDAQMPYPAVVFDRKHDTLWANMAAIRFQCWLYDVATPAELPEIANNVLRGLLHPEGYRSHIANWDDITPVMLRRLRAEAIAPGDHEPAVELLKEMTSYPGVPDDWRSLGDPDYRIPMLTVDFAKDDEVFSLFSTITTLGTSFDVTLQEIRIESFFPADEGARSFFAKLAA
ncbi:MAG: helix-turn-helix transcriptional regulator [Pseudomonadota bacterium]